MTAAATSPAPLDRRRWLRDLAYTLVERQWRLRTKRSWVGLIWPVFAPLGLTLLYVLVFKRVFTVPVKRYPNYLIAGMLPWTFMSSAVGRAVTSVATEGDVL